jgi:N-acetylmuramoyl-L-alanine amidase
METNPSSPVPDLTKPKKSKENPGILKGTVINLEIVIGVAIILAILFTAWTPGESGQKPAWEISQIAPLPSALPTLVLTPTAHQRPLIGIVSGHWGNDSGATCSDGLTEAEINQNIATMVQKQLNAKGFDVNLLKEFDPRLTNFKALALVSIHADSCDYINDQATGYKVAAALASPNPERATNLTSCLRARYAQATGLPLHSTSVTGDMTNYHAFSEIDESTTAAIIETGFLNLDRKFLTENADLAAQGIVNGILCFLNNETITSQSTQTTP